MTDALDGTLSGRGLRALGGLLRLLCTGCPETWGIDGTMDKAMRKDIQQMGRHEECPLSNEERGRRCGDPKRRAQNECPPECI